MLRDRIKEDILKAVTSYRGPVTGDQLPEVVVTRTTDAKFGDFSTNVALKVDRGSSQSSQDFAKKLADSLKGEPYVEKLEVAGPGFLNFWIKPQIWQSEVENVLKSGDKYGSNSEGKGKKARVEFVSANPTGPLHFGNARGGPIGDALASVLEFSGYKVVREYLHNDVGGQVDKLGESVLNVASGKKLEDQEYKGEYIKDLANVILGSEATPESKKADSGQALRLRSGQLKGSELNRTARMTSTEVGKKAVDIIFEEIKVDCAAMGITFDEFYPESGFINSGQTKKRIDYLREKGVVVEKDGALWFAPHLRQGSGGQANDEFLNDRETVVVKSDGAYTYFANDIAYHDLKFKDDPALVVDILGANHHGHVPRLNAAVGALGYDVSKFHVILYQWVRFVRKGELVAMSKRSGTFVSAREVLDEVGKDALRFFILMHDPNSHIDFDLELAKEKSKENPVYYVQYAHARICSILENVGGRGPSSGSMRGRTSNTKLLSTSYELDLIKQISRLPELVEDISQNFAVQRLTAYATELADSFHRFYENCRVVGEKEDLMNARLALITATKITLENTLNLLGISAPEKM